MRTIIIILLMSGIAIADCNWSTIYKSEQGYVYSQECHIKVGELKLDYAYTSSKLRLTENKVGLLTTQRDLWKLEAERLDEDLQRAEKSNSLVNWMYFGCGVVATSLSVYLAGKLVK